MNIKYIKNKLKKLLITRPHRLSSALAGVAYYLLLITLIIIFPIQAQAQTIGLSISPPLLEVMIQPGKSITQAYEVANNSDRDLYLNARLVPFTPADHFGNISLDLGHTLRGVHSPRFGEAGSEHLGGVTSMFSLQNSDIDLNQPFKVTAGGKQQLVLKINVPPENQEKDYYYTFLIEQTDRGEQIPTTSGTSHRIKIGSNILLTVSESGQPEIDFQISEFKAEPKFGDIFDTVNFKLLIENTGQAFFKPEGKIEIYNTLFNKKMAELDLLPENVLVDSVRQIRCASSTSAEENPAQGKTSEVSEDLTSEVGELGEKENLKITECQFSTWLPGKYKAVIVGDTDNSRLVGTSRDLSLRKNTNLTHFYLIPYRLILALLIIFLITWQIKQKQTLDKG